MTSDARSSLTIRRSIVLDRPGPEVFVLWTEHAGDWWPFVGASHHGADAIDLTFEPQVGGRVFETVRDGSEVVWGHLLVWDPPHRFVYSYRPFADERLTEVEVRFEQLPGGRTEVHVEHRGWEAHGEDGVQRSAGYSKGWANTLEVLSNTAKLDKHMSEGGNDDRGDSHTQRARRGREDCLSR